MFERVIHAFLGITLTHFRRMFPLYTPLKTQKTRGYWYNQMLFSGLLDYWTEISQHPSQHVLVQI